MKKLAAITEYSVTRPKQQPPVPSEKMLLPRKLTAENGAKYALIGEFFEEVDVDVPDGDDGDDTRTISVPVSWDTIKRIWDKAVAHFEALDKQERESMVAASEEAPHGGDPAA